VGILDNLAHSLAPARTVPARSEQRYSFNQWANDAIKFGGLTYTGSPIQTLYGKTPAEHIGSDFEGLVRGALQMSGPVSAVEMVRLLVFAEARFQWQRISNGRPGDLFGTQDLAILETPWTGGTTGDLLARMILDADFAGNSYTARIGAELVRLRPDWVDIVLAPREYGTQTVGLKRVGYAFYDGGDRRNDPVIFLPEEVAHFAPYPDPLGNYRGISWLTPVIREIQSDRAATQHKLKFFENAATPNLAVALAKEVTPEQFHDFVEQMDRSTPAPTTPIDAVHGGRRRRHGHRVRLQAARLQGHAGRRRDPHRRGGRRRRDPRQPVRGHAGLEPERR
jgi:hypothetical protein